MNLVTDFFSLYIVTQIIISQINISSYSFCHLVYPLALGMSILFFQKIPVSLLKKLNAKFDDDRSELCIPLSNKSVEVGYKRFGSDSELTFPASGAAGFIANLNGNDSAVIVPSLKDLVALSLYKSAFDIICLPYGKRVSCIDRYT